MIEEQDKASQGQNSRRNQSQRPCATSGRRERNPTPDNGNEQK
jgi:hypothetical protein